MLATHSSNSTIKAHGDLMDFFLNPSMSTKIPVLSKLPLCIGPHMKLDILNTRLCSAIYINIYISSFFFVLSFPTPPNENFFLFFALLLFPGPKNNTKIFFCFFHVMDLIRTQINRKHIVADFFFFCCHCSLSKEMMMIISPSFFHQKPVKDFFFLQAKKKKKRI